MKLAIPTHRIDVRSELVMLGDSDGGHRWTATGQAALVASRSGDSDILSVEIPYYV